MQISIPGLSTTVVLIPSCRGNGSTEVTELIFHMFICLRQFPDLCVSFLNLTFVSLMLQVPGGWSFITDQVTAPGPSGPPRLQRPPCCCSFVLLTPCTAWTIQFMQTHTHAILMWLRNTSHPYLIIFCLFVFTFLRNRLIEFQHLTMAPVCFVMAFEPGRDMPQCVLSVKNLTKNLNLNKPHFVFNLICV